MFTLYFHCAVVFLISTIQQHFFRSFVCVWCDFFWFLRLDFFWLSSFSPSHKKNTISESHWEHKWAHTNCYPPSNWKKANRAWNKKKTNINFSIRTEIKNKTPRWTFVIFFFWFTRHFFCMYVSFFLSAWLCSSKPPQNYTRYFCVYVVFFFLPFLTSSFSFKLIIRLVFLAFLLKFIYLAHSHWRF